MQELQINLPRNIDPNVVEAVIDEVCVSEALTITMKGALKMFPGSTHWHLKHGKERGILEVTWWPRPGETEPARLWLSAHGNRMAEWVEPRMPHLKAVIEARLAEEA